MNRRLGGDASLNSQVRADAEGEWQDWLVDDSDSQEILVENEEFDNLRKDADHGLGEADRPRTPRL